MEGSSGYGRPSSLAEYNQLPVAPVSQSSTLTYQTSHPQSEQPIKNLMCSGGVKTLCCVFIVCRAVTFWLSLLLVANNLTCQLPTPLKRLIWHIIMSEMIFTTYVNVLKTKILSSQYNFLKTCFGMTHAIIRLMCCSVFHCVIYVEVI